MAQSQKLASKYSLQKLRDAFKLGIRLRNVPWYEVCKSKDLNNELCRSGFALDPPKGRAREQGGAREQNGNTTDTLEACLHFKAILDNAGCELKAQKLFLF